MEGVSLALSTVGTLLAMLERSDLKALMGVGPEKSKMELNELRDKFSTVQAVLIDAETKTELSKEAQIYIEELKDVVYVTDDVFDHLLSSYSLQEVKKETLSSKPRSFFSSGNQFVRASKMTRNIRRLGEKLKGMVGDPNQYDLSIDPHPIRNRREDISSYFYDDHNQIYGRDADVEKIVSILLDNNTKQDDVNFLSIVGMGGLGKTTLARMVFSDHRVVKAFSDEFSSSLPMWWTCVSDGDVQQFDVQLILRNILASATLQSPDADPLSDLQRKLGEILRSKKFLLVLDDVWTQCPDDWRKLEQVLLGGRKGSWVLVTTRSRQTASMIARDSKYELQGLSSEYSWSLFQNMAFKSGEETHIDQDFVDIGRQIAVKCCAVPLVLRVIGSLLYGQDKSKWLAVRDMVTTIDKDRDGIVSILMISYYNLDFSMRSCFSYCALFPKDFVLNKDILIRLWMAQGYAVPLDEGQSIEDAAEEHFIILLRRCFFQDVKVDAYGEIESFKIHDLMHDIAQKVAGKEVYLSNSVSDNIDERVRHLAHMGSRTRECPYTRKVRSYLQHQVGYGADVKMDEDNLRALVQKLSSVRALDLSNTIVQYLPHFISNLLHLRYLNLSLHPELEKLPMPFGKLYNLQTLMIQNCPKLQQLPESLSKLVNLRVLYINGCDSLLCLPNGVLKLTELSVLDISGCGRFFCLPSDLGKLTKLRVLKISDCNSLTCIPSSVSELTALRVLSISNCQSLNSMPNDVGSLSKLRILNIRNCIKLTCIPKNICKLTHLKVLSINNEYPGDTGELTN